MSEDLFLDVHEKPKSFLAWMFMSIQHVFAMFGATVLVPLITGLAAIFVIMLGFLGYIQAVILSIPLGV